VLKTRKSSLGVTHQLPVQERNTLPEDYLRDRLVVMMGGRCAEHELLGSVSSCADDDDIAQATALARAMVSRWGMSKKIGPVDCVIAKSIHFWAEKWPSHVIFPKTLHSRWIRR